MRIRIRKGLDIPLRGVPEQVIDAGPPLHHVALSGLDYIGLRPLVLVTPGDHVTCGQALFIDKHDPAVQFTSPASGVVASINRGPRRSLESVIIRLEGEQSEASGFASHTDQVLLGLDGPAVAATIQRAGLWPAFRTRPFSHVPHSDSRPHAIFVTAVDTQPLAADPRVIIEPDRAAFDSGLCALTRLTQGKIWLCTGAGWSGTGPGAERVQRVEFLGPHPAGLPGTHIHFLDPAGPGRTVWHVGYQDVIALGKLFSKGFVCTERVVSLAGDGIERPRLLRTRLGAGIDDLIATETAGRKSLRVVSGSLLSGRAAAGKNAFLGRYHYQVCVVPESGRRQPFDWLGLVSGRYSAASVLSRNVGKSSAFPFRTARHEPASALLPVGAFEQVMPLDLLPSPLLRALLTRDSAQAGALGCLELDEEDLALCSFVCPAKNDYGAALRINLGDLERNG